MALVGVFAPIDFFALEGTGVLTLEGLVGVWIDLVGVLVAV
jgi:hypothetical protein